MTRISLREISICFFFSNFMIFFKRRQGMFFLPSLPSVAIEDSKICRKSSATFPENSFFSFATVNRTV